jgi:hypothetical protein
VTLPVIEMSLPGSRFNAATDPTTSPRSSVEFLHPTDVSVVETTYFGVSFM